MSQKINRWMIILVSLVNVIGCQNQIGDSTLSQWSVAQWVMRQGLDPQGPNLDSLTPYLSKKALTQLTAFKKMLEPDEIIGLLTLNRSEGQRWVGRYGYLKGGWPLALNFEMTRANGYWQIENLPFSSIYAQLAQVLTPNGLPKVGQGEVWTGGLISYDRSGRPQGEVVITWIPPYAFVDGVPLEGSATSKKLITAIRRSFELRAQMASSVQASYVPRVALCLKSSAPATEVERLMGWAESAGAEVISLLAHDRQSTPILIRLARRIPQVALLSPQRLIKGSVSLLSARLIAPSSSGSDSPPPLHLSFIEESIRRDLDALTDPSQPIKQYPIKQQERIAQLQVDTSITERTTQRFFEFYKRSKGGGRIEGVVLSSEKNATYADILRVIDQMRVVDVKTSITLNTTSSISNSDLNGKKQ